VKTRVNNVNLKGKIKTTDRISFLNAKNSLDEYTNIRIHSLLKKIIFDSLQDKSHTE